MKISLPKDEKKLSRMTTGVTIFGALITLAGGALSAFKDKVHMDSEIAKRVKEEVAAKLGK